MRKKYNTQRLCASKQISRDPLYIKASQRCFYIQYYLMHHNVKVIRSNQTQALNGILKDWAVKFKGDCQSSCKYRL